MIDAYRTVTGLTFRSENVASLAEVKWDDKMRVYAEGFQRVLMEPVVGNAEDHLYQSIADAWTTAVGIRDIAGGFSAASKTLSVAGLLPGVGTSTGAIGLAADIGAGIASEKAATAEWYELGPGIVRQRSPGPMESELRKRGLL